MGDPIINTQVDAINTTLGTIKTDLTALRPSIQRIRDAVAETYLTETIQNQAIASFSDGADDIPVRELEVAITPVQSLNGQTSPWPAGGGKNLINIPDRTQTVNGVTATVNGGVVTLSGTATARAVIYLVRSINIPAGSYKFNGPQSVLPASFYLNFNSGTGKSVSVSGDVLDVALTLDTDTSGDNTSYVRIDIAAGTNTNDIVLKPMLRLATEADATFAPYSNICPITGWSAANVSRTGVNIWDEETEVISTNLFSKNFIKVEPSTDYYISTAGYNIQVSWYDEFKNAISNITKRDTTITSPNNAHYMKFFTASSYGTTYNHNISINYPSTDTAYHAYLGTTATLSFGQTVYGGTLNVTTGVLTIDRAMVDLGTLNWSKNTASSIDVGYYFGAPLANAIGVDLGRILSAYPMSDKLGLTQTVQAYGSSIDHLAFVASNTNQYIIDSDYADATAFKTAMSGVQLVYELATPIEVDIEAVEILTLFGDNNIFCSTGNVIKLVYRKSWEIALAEGE